MAIQRGDAQELAFFIILGVMLVSYVSCECWFFYVISSRLSSMNSDSHAACVGLGAGMFGRIRCRNVWRIMPKQVRLQMKALFIVLLVASSRWQPKNALAAIACLVRIACCVHLWRRVECRKGVSLKGVCGEKKSCSSHLSGCRFLGA